MKLTGIDLEIVGDGGLLVIRRLKNDPRFFDACRYFRLERELKWISRKTGVPVPTLKGWKRKWRECPLFGYSFKEAKRRILARTEEGRKRGEARRQADIEAATHDSGQSIGLRERAQRGVSEVLLGEDVSEGRRPVERRPAGDRRRENAEGASEEKARCFGGVDLAGWTCRSRQRVNGFSGRRNRG